MFCASTCSFNFNYFFIQPSCHWTQQIPPETNQLREFRGRNANQTTFSFFLFTHLSFPFSSAFFLWWQWCPPPPQLFSKPASVCGSRTRRRLGEKRSYLISLVIIFYSFFCYIFFLPNFCHLLFSLCFFFCLCLWTGCTPLEEQLLAFLSLSNTDDLHWLPSSSTYSDDF